jgi:CRISPR type III-associated protein (TIGR04423 family)
MSYFKSIEIENLNDYSSFNFEGYLWYSDKTSPEVINGIVQELHNKCSRLPFIVEGYLHSLDNKLSIHIRNYDGKYHIGVYFLDQIETITTKLIPVKFLANKKLANNTILPEIKFIKFTQVFELKEDIITKNNFKIWKPECKYFTGFEK